MTYKQVKQNVQAILESHPMIRKVLFNTPTEWIYQEGSPDFPIALFSIDGGVLEPGYKTFNLSFWFLDRSGMDGEFEVDIVSDQVEIANDIVAKLKQSWINNWLIDENVSFDVIMEKFEDYLSGVKFTTTLKTANDYDTCAIPAI